MSSSPKSLYPHLHLQHKTEEGHFQFLKPQDVFIRPHLLMGIYSVKFFVKEAAMQSASAGGHNWRPKKCQCQFLGCHIK